MVMNPTVLVIFGNPKVGTPLMIDKPIISIDLPLRALVWEDDGVKVWLTYDEPGWLAQGHGLTESSNPIVAAIVSGMKRVTDEACSSKRV